MNIQKIRVNNVKNVQKIKINNVQTFTGLISIEELNKTLDNKIKTSVDEKIGDIDTILTYIVGSTLEVDNKEY